MGARRSQDWDRIARQVVRGGVAALREHCPVVAEHVARVRENGWPLPLWGTSHNFDERARRQIVAAPVLRALAALAKVGLPVASCHAGLLHTYGYLFSTIDTPFGRKRDRWTSPAIERGFGIASPSLRPEPAAGTLLHNLTRFLAGIAWRDDARLLARLRRRPGGVADAIADYDYERLRVTRCSESTRLADRTLVELHTELVAYPNGPGGLLVYWQRTTRAGKQLLTAFPVTAAAMAEIAALPTGRVDDLRVHYNGAVAGFAEPRSGRREITAPASRAGRRSRTARRGPAA